MRLGQGRQAASTYLRENPDLLDEITKQVKIAYGIEFSDDDTMEPAAAKAHTSAEAGKSDATANAKSDAQLTASAAALDAAWEAASHDAAAEAADAAEH